MSRPLAGIRVLDFTHVLAGPYGSRVLADMGADVVKINTDSRAIGTNESSHPYYLMWNRNKRALALDLSSEEGQEIARELCARADIVMENFSPGVLNRWGISYELVRENNPDVIYLQMSGMGEGGPWSHFVTYAPTIHALSGLTHLTGVPGREDIGLGYSYNDHQAGLHGAVAVLAALEARHRTGKGQFIDMAQFEVGVNFAGPALLDYFANGTAARPMANRLPYDDAAPHGCYPCAGARSDATEDERWVAIACMTDQQWQSLRSLMGEPEWSRDRQFETAAGRVEAMTRLDAHIADWTGQREASHVMEMCQEAGVPAGVVQTGADLVEKDPQLARSGFLRQMSEPHPRAGDTYADRLPIHFHATPCEEYLRVREVGEDNAAVLGDWLDMSEDEVGQGEDDGIFK